MHNYYRRSKQKSQLRKEKSSNRHPVVGEDITWDSNDNNGYGCVELNDGDGVACSDESIKPCRYQYMQWQPEIIHDNTKGGLYRVRAVRSDSNEGMILIRLRGQAFLLNQIRLMISAAVLYARGIIPWSLIRLSLDTPYRCPLPRAPAEGLILLDSGFFRNVSGQSYHLHPYLEDDMNESSGREFLMTKEDFDASENFKRSKIYHEIYDNWSCENGTKLMNR